MTTIESLDPADDVQYAEFYSVYAAALGDEWDRPYSAREKRLALQEKSEYQEVIGALGRNDAGVAVVAGTIDFSLKDNVDVGFIEVGVAPGHRRQGHGSAMVAHLVELNSSRGRTSLMGEVRWDEGQTGSGHTAFAEACGFHLDMADAHRVLDLPTALPEAPARDGYTMVSWRRGVPDEWIDQYAHLVSRLVEDSPSGDFPLENEFYDAGRIRADERLLAEQGRVMQVVAAVSPDGELVGHTQLVFPESDPGDVYQWATLVLPEHRGHGLGLSLKVEAMRVSADLLEGRRFVHTYNHADNGPMIAVNEVMGFRRVGWLGEFVRNL
jgi:GNAT superfamily N-acetyltransferase